MKERKKMLVDDFAKFLVKVCSENFSLSEITEMMGASLVILSQIKGDSYEEFLVQLETLSQKFGKDIPEEYSETFIRALDLEI